jgi:hypothetical protein
MCISIVNVPASSGMPDTAPSAGMGRRVERMEQAERALRKEKIAAALQSHFARRWRLDS